MTDISRVDELVVRRKFVNQILANAEKEAEDKILLKLAGAFDEDAETKAYGMVVFLERWIKEIEDEMQGSYGDVLKSMFKKREDSESK